MPGLENTVFYGKNPCFICGNENGLTYDITVFLVYKGAQENKDMQIPIGNICICPDSADCDEKLQQVLDDFLIDEADVCAFCGESGYLHTGSLTVHNAMLPFFTTCFACANTIGRVLMRKFKKHDVLTSSMREFEYRRGKYVHNKKHNKRGA